MALTSRRVNKPPNTTPYHDDAGSIIITHPESNYGESATIKKRNRIMENIQEEKPKQSAVSGCAGVVSLAILAYVIYTLCSL